MPKRNRIRHLPEKWRAAPDLFEKVYSTIPVLATAILFLGYGDITPRTGGGKIFSILVMIIGIPVNMYMFVSIAGLLSKAVMCMKNGAARLMCRSSGSSGPDMICFFICIIIALIYLIVGGIGIGLCEGTFPILLPEFELFCSGYYQ